MQKNQIFRKNPDFQVFAEKSQNAQSEANMRLFSVNPQKL